MAPGKGAAGRNGLLQPLINNIRAAIPGSTVKSIVYQKGTVIAATARVQVANAIKSYAASCPNTPIMLLGYSVVCGIIST